MRLVRRQCEVCEWEGVQIEPADADPDCPWCHHAPTTIVEVLQDTVPLAVSPSDGKNPYAAALGRLGGQKGGRARAQRLSKRRRSEIARKAARARWKKKKSATS